MDEDKLKLTVENAVNSPDCVDLLAHLIEKSGCFREGLHNNERQEIYNRGYGDFGLYIRRLLLNYVPEVYIGIIKKGVQENDDRAN